MNESTIFSKILYKLTAQIKTHEKEHDFCKKQSNCDCKAEDTLPVFNRFHERVHVYIYCLFSLNELVLLLKWRDKDKGKQMSAFTLVGSKEKQACSRCKAKKELVLQ